MPHIGLIVLKILALPEPIEVPEKNGFRYNDRPYLVHRSKLGIQEFRD
jgi:hypothetical protein